MSELAKFKKQPAEILDYDLDYSKYFKDRVDSVLSVDLEYDAGITIESTTLSSNIVKVVVSGGISGKTYKFTIMMTTTTGIVKEDEFYIVVDEI
jgi:hypothetical protein